jgi:hypothetical protein
MKWLIQPIKIEEDKIKSLINLLDIAQVNYDIVFPLDGEVYNKNKELYQYDDKELYFVCGSYSLTRNVYKNRRESVFSLDDYDYNDLMSIFGKENFVNDDAVKIHSKDIDWKEEEYFIRPFKDDKSFNGGIYNKNTLKYEGDVFLSRLKHVSKEFRFFVLDGKIITESMYKLNGELYTKSVVDEEAKNFANKMIEKFNFPGFVIDIALVNNHYKIMELNCFNASGFYDINLYKFVDEVLNYYENVDKKNNKKLKI